MRHFFAWFSHDFLFHFSITQCVIDEFNSFLQHLNRRIEIYNMIFFNIYHIAKCVCVLEIFNCILLDDWILNFDIEFWFDFELFSLSITQCVIDEFDSFLQHWNRHIEIYNMIYFNIHHMIKCVCVFEIFNCMLFDDWILIFDIEFFTWEFDKFK